MTLQERVQAELTSAIKSGDVLRRDTLRMAVAALYNAEKAARRPLADDESLGVLAREVKTRRESVDAYRRAGRDDLAAKEEREVAILSEFLPQALGEHELRALVVETIAAVGATSARDLGRVMAVLSPKTKGRADGRQVSALVAQELARRDLAAHASDHAVDAAPDRAR